MDKHCTLDEAKRLAGAGFNADWKHPSICFYKNGKWIQGTQCERLGMPEIYEAPNSDELIADIKQRWGDVGYDYVVLRVFRDDVELHNVATGKHGPIRPTLLSALIDLYCKLAEPK